jgi:hypothetical protein
MIDGEVAMVECVEVVVAFGELLGMQDRGHGWPENGRFDASGRSE